MAVRVVVSGYSRVGKSPMIGILQDLISEAGKTSRRIWAGQWVIAQAGWSMTDQSWRHEPASRDLLRSVMKKTFDAGDWSLPSEYMEADMASAPADVYFLDGIRNPFDLVKILRPGDTILLLPIPEGCAAIDSFEEQGVDAVRAIAKFAQSQFGLKVVQVEREGELFTPENLRKYAALLQ
jgi:hypothetical protein